MQLLLYAWLSGFTLIVGNVPHLINVIKKIIDMKKITWKNVDKTFVIRVELGFVVCFMMICCFFVIMTIFFKFHIQLVTSNSTTIEHLEAKRNALGVATDQYDIGYKHNWLQVFGEQKFLWFVP